MFSAQSPVTPGTILGIDPSETPSISSRFDAGSVLTKSTRLPRSAKAMALAQLSEVLPTPPFRKRFETAVGLATTTW